MRGAWNKHNVSRVGNGLCDESLAPRAPQRIHQRKATKQATHSVTQEGRRCTNWARQRPHCEWLCRRENGIKPIGASRFLCTSPLLDEPEQAAFAAAAAAGCLCPSAAVLCVQLLESCLDALLVCCRESRRFSKHCLQRCHDVLCCSCRVCVLVGVAVRALARLARLPHRCAQRAPLGALLDAAQRL